MKKVVIVGGGLAGLTAAFYLSKHSDYEIEIFEAQEVIGGRVQTIDVKGFKFNYGAFMIFPWYKSFNKLLHELKYDHNSEHLDIDKEYSWDSTEKLFHRINRHWTYDDAPIAALLKALPTFLTHEAELYNPDPARFDGQSVKQYIDDLSNEDERALDAINKLIVGYTYGAIYQLPMSIYFGFAKEILIHSGFKHVKALSRGADRVVSKLEEALLERGVSLHTSSPVELDKNLKASVLEKPLEYDYLIMATAENNLLSPLLGIENPVAFNDHYVAMVKTENKVYVNGESDWNLLYTATLDDSVPQLTCIANLENTFPEKPKNSLITYLRIPTSKSSSYDLVKAKQEIIDQICKVLSNPGKVSVEFIHHWENTMPILGIEALAKIQSMQGVDKIFFAGDYMGAPSMEVAVRSGEEAARLIVDSP